MSPIKIMPIALLVAFSMSHGATEGPTLTTLLSRAAEVAELYRDAALRFACEETIAWSKGSSNERKQQEFGYVFRYSPHGGFSDYRTKYKRGRDLPVIASPEKYGIPVHLDSAYLWVFVFKRSRHHLHHYEIVGRETVHGRAAVKILFEPKQPYDWRSNFWFGWAWVDADSAQPLRFEVYEPSHWRAKTLIENPQIDPWQKKRRCLVQRIITDFMIEKNGMRFPSSVRIFRARYKRRGDEWVERPLLRVDQTYNDYRFFGVRTRAEIETLTLP